MENKLLKNSIAKLVAGILVVTTIFMPVFFKYMHSGQRVHKV